MVAVVVSVKFSLGIVGKDKPRGAIGGVSDGKTGINCPEESAATVATAAACARKAAVCKLFKHSVVTGTVSVEFWQVFLCFCFGLFLSVSGGVTINDKATDIGNIQK
ncbi:hypothetical protein Smp_173200 [Schistosoma mansoni]|uniref:Uncharacterized protein n=1 Tax=Schistosoma mansoni TaxID=6183 RepID=G4VJZ4_SCHMA|nr:hypothetical protein Smp_173200 [Schistosoma mansoni]|eukprot:XP_018652604.1 hypothetical protein Smp_173200 [Schistosoma mansoni]